MLLAAECDARGRGDASHDFATRPYPQMPHLLAAMDAARAVNAGEIAARCAEKKERIPEEIHAARVRAVKEVLSCNNGTVEDDT